MQILIVVFITLAAVAAVLVPILRADRSSSGGGALAPGPMTDEAIEAGVRRYREALRAGTVCRRCLRANPAGSRYCAECGRRLG